MKTRGKGQKGKRQEAIGDRQNLPLPFAPCLLPLASLLIAD